MEGNEAYIIFHGGINPDRVNQLIIRANEFAQMGHPLVLALSSWGGSIMSGFTAYHALKAIPAEITTWNIGHINSIANVVYLAGTERYANAFTTFLLHGTNWTFANGNGSDIPLATLREAADSLTADEGKIAFAIGTEINKPGQEIKDIMDQNKTLASMEALDLGLVSTIQEFEIPPGAPVITI